MVDDIPPLSKFYQNKHSNFLSFLFSSKSQISKIQKNCPHNNILKESQHKFYSKAVSVNWIGVDYKMCIKTFYVMSTLLPSNVFISGDSFYHLGIIYYKYSFSKTMIYVSYG